MHKPAIAGLAAAFVAAVVQGQLTDRGDARLGYWLLAPLVGFLTVRLLTRAGSAGPGGRLRPFVRRTPAESELSTPPSLRRSERLVRYGPRDSHTASHRLLPALRELASERLADRHRLSFDTPQAKALLGHDVWELLAPSWAAARTLSSPGPTRAQLEQAVTAIEELN